MFIKFRMCTIFPVPPPFPKEIFIELMQSSFEFSFNNTMYRQTDGVAMGSPLRPALANTFFGYQETQPFLNVKKPLNYNRYVDDTFAVFENEDDFENFFLTQLSLLFFTFHVRKKLNSSLFRFLTS